MNNENNDTMWDEQVIAWSREEVTYTWVTVEDEGVYYPGNRQDK